MNNSLQKITRGYDEIRAIIHKGFCPRGFWFEENRNEQERYIEMLVEEELNIKTPAAYLCLFHINDLLKLNTSIQAAYGIKNTYELLERKFKIPRHLLAYNKNMPRGKKSEYHDFCKRISDLTERHFISYNDDYTTDRTDYPWYNLFDKAEADVVADMYKNRTAYRRFINTIFYGVSYDNDNA